MSTRIEVLLADDDAVARIRIRAMLEAGGIDVIGEAADGREAVFLAGELSPDVILMDLVMPAMDGVAASREIRGARILAMTDHQADSKLLAGVRDCPGGGQVAGYLHKKVSQEELVEAVRKVDHGELVFPTALSRKLLAPPADSPRRAEARLQTLHEAGVILHTKLYRPPVPEDFVVREELLARLEAGLRLPLTLVSAPAGYGKTSLLSHWLETRSAATRSAATTGTPSAWLSLEAADSDLPIFLRYFVAAVHTLFPTACEGTAALLEAGELPPPAVLGRRLLNELAAISESFVLVLDDYHLVDRGEQVADERRDVLAALPQGWNLQPQDVDAEVDALCSRARAGPLSDNPRAFSMKAAVCRRSNRRFSDRISSSRWWARSDDSARFGSRRVRITRWSEGGGYRSSRPTSSWTAGC